MSLPAYSTACRQATIKHIFDTFDGYFFFVNGTVIEKF